MTRVRFLPAAELELLREVAYYSKAHAGTGIRFQAAVEAAVMRVVHHPSGGAASFIGPFRVVAARQHRLPGD